MNLLYTTIGYNSSYIQCLQFLLQSIKHYTPNPSFDILVICDEQFLPSVIPIVSQTCASTQNLIFLTTPNSTDVMCASINKLKVFEYHNIERYCNVIYIDTDILCTLNVNTMFERLEAETRDEKGVLYAFKEQNDILSHKNSFWSMGTYSDKDIEYFERLQIYPFNAGCFAFHNQPIMHTHFKQIQRMIQTSITRHFFEQAYMNVYFNLRNLVNYTLINSNNYVMFPNLDTYYKDKIIHFCGSPGNGNRKELIMLAYIQKFILTANKYVPLLPPQ